MNRTRATAAHGTPRGDALEVVTFAEQFDELHRAVGAVVHGAESTVRLALVCLVAEGHLLIEDLPGVGKTTLARTLATCIGGQVARVQFTPDLLPSDLLGVNVMHLSTHETEFRPGPVFANVVHADEINRASPKLQSALLEVMEERQVTTEGVTREVPSPFFVIATQNPVELEGTFRLPAAQLDRFLIRTSMGTPTIEEEVAMVGRVTAPADVDASGAPLGPVLTPNGLDELISCAAHVHASDEVIGYATAITRATRTSPDVRMGASPRATVGLVRAAKALAASQARSHVTPDDVRTLAEPVLAHRLECTTAAALAGIGAADVVRDAVAAAHVPRRRRPAS